MINRRNNVYLTMGHSLRLLDKKKRQPALKMTARAVEETPQVETRLLGLSIPELREQCMISHVISA